MEDCTKLGETFQVSGEPSCVYQLNQNLTFRFNLIHIQFEMYKGRCVFIVWTNVYRSKLSHVPSAVVEITRFALYLEQEKRDRSAAPVAVPPQSLRLLYQLSEWHWTALRVNGLDRPLLVGGTALLTGYRFGSPSNHTIYATYISLRWDIRRVSSIWNRLLKLKLWISICTHDTWLKQRIKFVSAFIIRIF